MKSFKRIIVALALICSLLLPNVGVSNVQHAHAATYTANWGQREVVATSLSDSAVAFYQKYN